MYLMHINDITSTKRWDKTLGCLFIRTHTHTHTHNDDEMGIVEGFIKITNNSIVNENYIEEKRRKQKEWKLACKKIVGENGKPSNAGGKLLSLPWKAFNE